MRVALLRAARNAFAFESERDNDVSVTPLDAYVVKASERFRFCTSDNH